MKELTAKWGNDVGVVLVSDQDYARLVEHKWHITTNNASRKPYVRTHVGRTTVYMHRMIVGCPATFKVDHKNNDGLHNYRSNLRVASHVDNNLNREGWGISGFKGVTLDRQRYRARITFNGETRVIGRFATALEAALAYDKAAYELFGEFAWFNFPETWTKPELEPVEVPF